MNHNYAANTSGGLQLPHELYPQAAAAQAHQMPFAPSLQHQPCPLPQPQKQPAMFVAPPGVHQNPPPASYSMNQYDWVVSGPYGPPPRLGIALHPAAFGVGQGGASQLMAPPSMHPNPPPASHSMNQYSLVASGPSGPSPHLGNAPHPAAFGVGHGSAAQLMKQPVPILNTQMPSPSGAASVQHVLNGNGTQPTHYPILNAQEFPPLGAQLAPKEESRASMQESDTLQPLRNRQWVEHMLQSARESEQRLESKKTAHTSKRAERMERGASESAWLTPILVHIFPTLAQHPVLLEQLLQNPWVSPTVDEILNREPQPTVGELKEKLKGPLKLTLDAMQEAYLSGRPLLDDPYDQRSTCKLKAKQKQELEVSLQLHINMSGGLLGKSEVSCRPNGYLLPVPQKGYLDRPPEELAGYCNSEQYRRLLQGSLTDPEALVSSTEGLCDIHPFQGFDFGLQRCGHSTGKTGYDGDGALLPSATRDVVVAAREARDAPTFYRTLEVTNISATHNLAILGVHAQPTLLPALSLTDDLGYGELCFGSLHAKAGPREQVLWIPPGGTYSFTVQLRCVASQQGILQQWLLLVCYLAPPPSEHLAHAQHRYQPFVTGRQVVATVAQNPDHVTQCMELNANAKPFYPLPLRTLFDTPACTFVRGASPATMLLGPQVPVPHELLPAMHNLCRVEVACDASVMQPEGGAQQQRWHTALEYMEACANSKKHAQGQHGRTAQTGLKLHFSTVELQRWLRLLRLEANSQLNAIKHYDQFYCVLGRDVRPVTVADSSGNQVTHVLYKLNVPGLPEARPPLHVGDVVFLRPAGLDERSIEVVAAIWSVSTREATIHLCLPDTKAHGAKEVRWTVRSLTVAGPVTFGGGIKRNVSVGLRHRTVTQELSQTKEEAPLHVRFVNDNTFVERQLAALERASRCPFPLLPLPPEASLDKAEVSGKREGKEEAEARVRPPRGNRVESYSDGYEVSAQLNDEQRHCVEQSLSDAVRGQVYVLFGPPGTGKTITVVECIMAAVRRRAGPTACVLVCAPAAFAADVICSKLKDHGLSNEEMVRLNDPRRDPATVKTDVTAFCSKKEQVFCLPPARSAANVRVWVCSNSSAALLSEAPEAWRRHLPKFTHIFLDEAGQGASVVERSIRRTKADGKGASIRKGAATDTGVWAREATQATVPESLIPMSFAGRNCSVLLAGDPHQLGPIVHSAHAARSGFDMSLLELYMIHRGAAPPRGDERGMEMLRTHTPVDATWHHPLVTRLVRNYRSHQDILDLPSRLYYGGELQQASSAETVALPDDVQENLSLQDGVRTIFYGVQGKQMQEKDAPSYFNVMEAVGICNLVESMLSNASYSLTVQDIGVMATYRRQVQKIRELLRNRGLSKVRVGTVDDYQGQEERIIFISTVLTKPATVEGGNAATDPNLSFLTSEKRFNVAVSRAKVLNVVFGHPVVLMECKPWKELLRRCISRGSYRGYGEKAIPQWLRQNDGTTNQNAGANGATERFVFHGRGNKSGRREEANADTEEEDNDEEEKEEDGSATGGEEADEDLVSAIGHAAELSLLGMGHVEQMYPEDLYDLYMGSAFIEEQEWRVAL